MPRNSSAYLFNCFSFSSFCCALSCCFCFMTCTTHTPPLGGYPSIFRSVFMPVLAVCAGLLPYTICFSTTPIKSKIEGVFLCVYNLCIRKSLPCAFYDGVNFFACQFGEVHRKIFFSFNDKFYSTSSISLLFFSGRPFAIIFIITFIIIDSIECFAMRSWPHISQKIKVIKPLFAYFDASATVIFISFPVGWVVATIDHTPPNGIEGWWNYFGHLDGSPWRTMPSNSIKCLVLQVGG